MWVVAERLGVDLYAKRGGSSSCLRGKGLFTEHLHFAQPSPHRLLSGSGRYHAGDEGADKSAHTAEAQDPCDAVVSVVRVALVSRTFDRRRPIDSAEDGAGDDRNLKSLSEHESVARAKDELTMN